VRWAFHAQGTFGSEPGDIGPISNEECDQRLKENEERDATEQPRKQTEELHQAPTSASKRQRRAKAAPVADGDEAAAG